MGSGVVQSRNFPDDYGDIQKDCLAVILVQSGRGIKLEFITYNVQTSDSVAVSKNMELLILIIDDANSFLNCISSVYLVEWSEFFFVS